MIPNMKFRSVKDIFKRKLKEFIPKIMRSSNIFFYADKTNNIYEMPEQQHKKLDNVTKAYKKLPPKLETSIIFETKKVMNRAAVNYNLI